MKITKVFSYIPLMARVKGLFSNVSITEICEDVKEECEKYGPVVDMKVPRPTGSSRQAAGVGKIYVKFDTPESATAALKALAGRKFADRTVVTTYFSEVSNFIPFILSLQTFSLTLFSFSGKLRRQRLVKQSSYIECLVEKLSATYQSSLPLKEKVRKENAVVLTQSLFDVTITLIPTTLFTS